MRARVIAGVVVSVLFAKTAAAQQPPPPAAELTSLRVLHEKGVLSDAEYQSALSDTKDTNGARGSESTTVAMGKWATTIYGFIEADQIWDSTQSFADLAGNAQVERPGPVPLAPPAAPTRYKGDHGRTTFSVRNSRFGFRLKAPEASGVRTSATLELDFLGNQPTVSEGSFFTSPTARVRHAYVKIETPVVDVLVGQTWHLFGWQSAYHPNTVEIQGVPGQLYGRTPQVRVSKSVDFGPVTFEAALAAVRPPQRDGEVPEGQGGLRLAVDDWTGMTTAGATGTSIMPLSLAVTGDVRQFAIPEFSQTPTKAIQKTTAAVAVDAFVPVLPATKDKRDNSLALNGEFVTGNGIADMYTGLTGGMTFPSIPNALGINPPPPYPANVDAGLVTFDQAAILHPIQWTSYLFGVQYYLPKLEGRMWISANYSHMQSGNTSQFVNFTPTTNPANINYPQATSVRESEDWFDVNVFGDVGSGVRLGAEYANFDDRYTDGVHAINHRVQGSAFFLF